MRFVCPRCKGSLIESEAAYRCRRCGREYPVICGIADFRLYPDPYISIEHDRMKGVQLFEEGSRRSFADLVSYYYSITPEVPPDHAARWTRHTLSQVNIARETLERCGVSTEGDGVALLDIGCSTGGLLVAAGTRRVLAGVDVAFRWLVVAQRRLAELNIAANLVCANAEALPFRDGTFDVVTAIDVIEHVRDPRASIRESRRVLAEGGRMVCAANNRFAPLPDPQVGVWAVGYVPRRWQPAYVAKARKGLHVYQVRMPSAAELTRLFRQAGYRRVRTDPAPLVAPHVRGQVQNAMLAAYNRIRNVALAKPPLRLLGPRLLTVGER